MVKEWLVKTEQEKLFAGPKTAVCMPPHEISNQFLVSYLNRKKITSRTGKPVTEEGIYETTGIKERFWTQRADEPVISRAKIVPEMASQVVKGVLEKKGWEREDLDALIATTTFPFGWSLSWQVKDNLAIEGHPYFVDIYAACSGFSAALNHIFSFQEDFKNKKIVIVASEQYSPHLEGLDMTIFGDGAAALAFEYGKDLEILASQKVIFGNEAKSIKVPVKKHLAPTNSACFLPIPSPSGDFLEMDGVRIFVWACREVPEMILYVLNKAHLNLDNISLIIPHQANDRITKKIGQALGTEKIYSAIENMGNTSSASIPMAWYQAAKEGRIKKNDIIVTTGFGAGLAIYANVIKILT